MVPNRQQKRGVLARPRRMLPPKLYVGGWIRRLGRRPVEIATAIGITEPYLSEIISGHKSDGRPTNPSLAVAIAIADELGITVNDLRQEPPPQSAIEATHNLDPAQIVALGRLLDEMKPKK